MRIALVIFALWVLVVEPTFGAYERMEQQSSHHDRSNDEGCSDCDQQIPPGEVIAPQWVNQHVLDVLAVSLLDPLSLTSPLDSLASIIPPGPLPAKLCMPYPPAALPLRF